MHCTPAINVHISTGGRGGGGCRFQKRETAGTDRPSKHITGEMFPRPDRGDSSGCRLDFNVPPRQQTQRSADMKGRDRDPINSRAAARLQPPIHHFHFQSTRNQSQPGRGSVMGRWLWTEEGAIHQAGGNATLITSADGLGGVRADEVLCPLK